MTFGLLSAAQMALLTALAGAAVLVIFFLKVRHPLMVVPSLVLWQRVLNEHTRDSWRERLRRLISLLIALAIAWLLAIAIGEPRPDGISGGRLLLVIDNGPTMSAVTEGGGTRLERAIDAARGLVGAGGDARFQVADTTGAVRTPPNLDRQQTLAALARIRPGFGVPRTPAPASGYEPVYFTDAARLDPPPSARVVSLFERVPNAGITAFEIRATPSRPFEHSAYLSIVNFDNTPRDVDVGIGAPGQPRVQRTVPLGPGASLRQVLPIDELEPGVVEARIRSAGDRVPTDDVAFAWLPGRDVWRVALVTPGQPALAAVLASDPRVALQVLTPDVYTSSLDADIVVFDRFAPEAAPRQPALLFAPPNSDWLPVAPDARTLPSLVAVDSNHPVMAAVTLDDLHVTRSVVLAAPDATVLAADTGQPVMTAGQAAAPWVAVGFALDDANFVAQPAFPIFIANTLTWFRGEADALTTQPGVVRVPGAGHTIVDLDGRDVLSSVTLGATTFVAERPGVFFASSRGVRRPVVVQPADIQWSERAELDAAVPARADEVAASASRPWWTWLALAALLLLAAEWWTWQRRITV